MVQKWCLCFIAFLGVPLFLLDAEPVADALALLKNSPHGFSFVEMGITSEELADFSSLDIREERFYHQFGELSSTESGVAEFLGDIGMNESTLKQRIAARVAQIVTRVMAATKQETAWVHLRASVPTDAYDIPRWHMDGLYFTPKDPDALLCKFVLTLIGSDTLFYPIPEELRHTAFKHMRDRKWMEQFCHPDQVLSPGRGRGAFFIGGHLTKAALHSEPPIHRNRLFFSMIPCSEEQLQELKAKVIAVYPKDKYTQNI